ncbi:MAG: hypothetical protein DPW22_09440, partial [Alphaproteobacteria bacterium]|nr:hypothetical protein [Alphaproteobacteria bacterium]
PQQQHTKRLLVGGHWHNKGDRITVGGHHRADFIRERFIVPAQHKGRGTAGFDGGGNYSLGIKEHIVFPEIDFDKVSDVWGLDITICTSARSDDEARALLTAFNFPFRQ